MPSAQSIGADIYVDKFRGKVFISGKGPLAFGAYPVLSAILQQLISKPGFSVSIPELYSSIWGGVYNPIVHEGKVHVIM